MKAIQGVVTDCLLLNIREEPSNSSPVLAILPPLTVVLIDDKFDDPFYYKIMVPGLIRNKNVSDISFDKNYHGYCVKKYVTLPINKGGG